MKKVFLYAIFFCLYLFTSAQSLPSYVPTNGLVGWWSFNGNANDLSGNSNHGLVYNCNLTTDRFGNSNKAYLFNGINSRIEIPDTSSLRCRKITLSVWVLKTTSATGRQIIYKGDYNNADNEAYSLNANIHFGIKQNSNCIAGNGWHTFPYNQGLASNQWRHLVSTYDGDSVKNYIDGVLKNISFLSGMIDSCINSNVRFGYTWSGYPTVFNGKIDDIGIWNRALSDAEILQLYQVPTIIEEISSQPSISVFVNQAEATVNITTPPSHRGFDYFIIDPTGRLLHKGKIQLRSTIVNISNWSSGIYILRVGNEYPDSKMFVITKTAR